VANGIFVGIDESKLWSMADALRNNMDAAEYKHVVLGVIFLKYISDAFEAKHAELETQRDQGADPEDRMSIVRQASSGCQRKLVGRTSKTTPPSRRSAPLLMRR